MIIRGREGGMASGGSSPSREVQQILSHDKDGNLNCLLERALERFQTQFHSQEALVMISTKRKRISRTSQSKTCKYQLAFIVRSEL